MTIKISKQQLLDDFSTLRNFCKDYLLHPIEHIKNPPLIEWQSAVAATAAINVVYGLLRAVYRFSYMNLAVGLVVTPVLASVVLLLAALFLYYFFQITFQQTHPFKKFASILFISYLPGSVFFVASALYPPLFLMGIIVMAALATVGLNENFEVPRKTILTLVSAGAFLAILFWVFDQLYITHAPVEPRTLDDIEEELHLEN